MKERTGLIKFKGNPLTLLGNGVSVGDKAPDFTVLANDLSPYSLASQSGTIRVLVVVPSLDTPVCAVETRKFNEQAAGLGDKVKVLGLSMDLPFAQGRWCAAEGITNVKTYSDHRDASLGAAYGVLIKELRLLARSVFVIDHQGVVRYAEIVPEVTEEPNYDAALKVVKSLL